MKFTHYKIGSLDKGTTVVVHLTGNAANVRLMDDGNFRSYKARRRHRYYGGLAKSSRIALTTTKRANWHVTVDLAGLSGRVKSNIEVLPKPLPPISRSYATTSPQDIVDAVDIKARASSPGHYDLFISHASEDKSEVVRPLAEKLRSLGLRVWYDDFEMKIGDSLRRKIDHGISNSRFGVVVLSPSFMGKGWTEYELDGIVTNDVRGHQKLLPIWHDLSTDDVVRYSPSLADKVALSTKSTAIDDIAQKIYEAIQMGGDKHG